MIKLERSLKPEFLTPEFIAQKTMEFKNNRTNVWNIDKLKIALLEFSYGKCAYCECFTNEESKYVEIEHFEDKERNPDKVLEWENLLPSCKRCNGAKGSHDVQTTPIINPCIDRPSDHLVLQLYNFRGKTQVGEDTIDALGLNRTDRAVFKRFEIGQKLIELLDNTLNYCQNFKNNPTTKIKNIIIYHVTDILRQCNKTAAYSALCASVLHSSSVYSLIKADMQDFMLWTEEMAQLDSDSKKNIIEMR